MTVSIALVGASGTGKTTLARALFLRLLAFGVDATLVEDARHAIPPREGRSPGPAELAALARDHRKLIDEAARHAVTVIDGGALSIAVACELRFGDTSLYPDALFALRSHALTLVTALDDGATARCDDREATDRLLRNALTRASASYCVVYGDAPARLATAWSLVQRLLNISDPTPLPASRREWTWTCDKCSDPVCEHRMFTDLLGTRR